MFEGFFVDRIELATDGTVLRAQRREVYEKQLAESLIKGGANVNAQSSLKWTPLDTVELSSAGSASWMDETGKPLRVTMQMAGIPIEMLATDRESAKAEFAATDIFTQSLLTIETEIPKDAVSVVYQLRPKKDKQLDLQPEKNDFQKVRPLDEGGVEVAVQRANHDALLKAKGHSGGIDFKYKMGMY